MLALARQHALDRVHVRQAGSVIPGRPAPAGRNTRRDRGAEAALGAGTDDFASLLAKAAAGQAALTAAKHCQQVLGGIGFTAEHELHHHVKRALLLDGLLGSARELTSRGWRATLRATGSAPRLVHSSLFREACVFALPTRCKSPAFRAHSRRCGGAQIHLHPQWGDRAPTIAYVAGELEHLFSQQTAWRPADSS